MKRIIIPIMVGALLAGGIALASHSEDKVNLCHKTSSETNPWVVQQVNANEEQSHLDNGDKLYAGPLKDNGHPDQKAGDEWCNAQNEPTPTPTPEPSVTPPSTNGEPAMTAPFNTLPATGAQG